MTTTSVSVRSAKGTSGKSSSRTVSFTIKPEVRIVRDGKACELKDLQKGETISVTFTAKPGSSLNRVTQISAGKGE